MSLITHLLFFLNINKIKKAAHTFMGQPLFQKPIIIRSLTIFIFHIKNGKHHQKMK